MRMMDAHTFRRYAEQASMTQIGRWPAEESPKRSTNLTLPAHLVAAARRLGVNLSQAAEAGIAQAVAAAEDAEYAARNRETMAAWSAFFETAGLPLAEYRQF
jgi:antitoxin CcdA